MLTILLNQQQQKTINISVIYVEHLTQLYIFVSSETEPLYLYHTTEYAKIRIILHRNSEKLRSIGLS